MHVREIWPEDLDRIHLAKYRVQWRAAEKTKLSVWVP
jgi:hypothetical protein